jgi:hypothetical protein
MRHYNKGLIDYFRRNGYSICKEQVEALETIGKNLQRKAEHACNGYHSERAERAGQTYIIKQLTKARNIMVDIGAIDVIGRVEFNGDPRGFSLKIRGLKSKTDPDRVLTNSAYEHDVVGF